MSLLMDEHWLTVNPWLAEKIGLHEALFLQQLRFWIQREMGFEDEQGRRWIYNSINSWMQQFPFIRSSTTFKRMLANLHRNGLLLTTTAFNKSALDKTLAYTINDEKMAELDAIYHEERETRKQNQLKGKGQRISSIATPHGKNKALQQSPENDTIKSIKMKPRECQNEPIESIKMNPRECQNEPIESVKMNLSGEKPPAPMAQGFAPSPRARVTITQTDNTNNKTTTTQDPPVVVSLDMENLPSTP